MEMGPNPIGPVSLLKRKLRHKDQHTQRDDHMWTQGEDGSPHSRDRVLKRSQVCQHLDLGAPATRSGRRNSLWFQLPDLWLFVMASQQSNIRDNCGRY